MAQLQAEVCFTRQHDYSGCPYGIRELSFRNLHSAAQSHEVKAGDCSIPLCQIRHIPSKLKILSAAPPAMCTATLRILRILPPPSPSSRPLIPDPTSQANGNGRRCSEWQTVWPGGSGIPRILNPTVLEICV